MNTIIAEASCTIIAAELEEKQIFQLLRITCSEIIVLQIASWRDFESQYI